MLAASAAFLTLAGPSFALDGGDMMKKLSAAIGAGGTVITFEKADVEGDTVTASGVEVGIASLPGDKLKIGDITFEGVKETEGGGYYAKSVAFPDVDKKQEDGHLSARDIQVQGLTIPANAFNNSATAPAAASRSRNGHGKRLSRRRLPHLVRRKDALAQADDAGHDRLRLHHSR